MMEIPVHTLSPKRSDCVGQLRIEQDQSAKPILWPWGDSRDRKLPSSPIVKVAGVLKE